MMVLLLLLNNNAFLLNFNETTELLDGTLILYLTCFIVRQRLEKLCPNVIDSRKSDFFTNLRLMVHLDRLKEYTCYPWFRVNFILLHWRSRDSVIFDLNL